MLDRVGFFLSLVGITALLVGGVGIGNAVAGYVASKTATIATLKCLGALDAASSSPRISLQILALALVGIAAGAGARRASLPAAAAPLLAGVLPVSVRLGLYPQPLALAALFGLLTTLVFLAVAARRDRPGAAAARCSATAVDAGAAALSPLAALAATAARRAGARGARRG